MRFRPVLLPAVFLLLAPVARASGESGKHPSLWTRALQIVHLAPRGEGLSHGEKKKPVRAMNLALDMDLGLQPIKLSETRQLKVTMSLANRSRKFVHLEFPTTQRFDLIIRDAAGKAVAQWSEDQSFSNEPAYVTVNPGERVEYHASISTRELSAGREYVVEGFFPQFNDLRIEKTIRPEK
ncbi:MAG: Intracellular proteinase inhibitor [Chthoniobacter sp.]|jgi:hypothetical protein|nr:Intracellular proteinase inhibitor [Chthoniobacter sp.]